MKKKYLSGENIIFFLSLIFVLILITSCNEEPIAPQEEHIQAKGMVFYSSGIEVARIETGKTNDTLTAPVGGLSDHIEIKFIGEDELEFSPAEDAPQSLAWEIENPSIADIWQHEGEEGAFEFHLEGLLVGETSIEFFAMHNDHSDFRSGNIPVKITNIDSSFGKPIGLEISDEDSGSKLVSITNTTVIGELNVSKTDTTNHLEVNFFDSYNRFFQPASPPHTLRIDIDDSSVVEITGQDDAEPWAFKIIGLKTGSTTITLNILHDGNVGASFEPITVNVN